MAQSFVQLPSDSTGKKLRTYTLANGDHVEAIDVIDHETPKLSTLSSVALAAGASVDLDATAITTATTGKLRAVTVAASVPLKAEIKTVDGAAVVRDVVFTSDAMLTFRWTAPDRGYITVVGGAGKLFRVTLTHLDTVDAADVSATIYWTEE